MWTSVNPCTVHFVQVCANSFRRFGRTETKAKQKQQQEEEKKQRTTHTHTHLGYTLTGHTPDWTGRMKIPGRWRGAGKPQRAQIMGYNICTCGDGCVCACVCVHMCTGDHRLPPVVASESIRSRHHCRRMCCRAMFAVLVLQGALFNFFSWHLFSRSFFRLVVGQRHFGELMVTAAANLLCDECEYVCECVSAK